MGFPIIERLAAAMPPLIPPHSPSLLAQRAPRVQAAHLLVRMARLLALAARAADPLPKHSGGFEPY